VLEGTSSRSLWSLLLRAAALSGHSSVVRRELASRVRDPRAAVAALIDLGDNVPEELAARVPITMAVLQNGPAPAPMTSTIL
jgi:hypothetical protein